MRIFFVLFVKGVSFFYGYENNSRFYNILGISFVLFVVGEFWKYRGGFFIDNRVFVFSFYCVVVFVVCGILSKYVDFVVEVKERLRIGILLLMGRLFLYF